MKALTVLNNKPACQKPVRYRSLQMTEDKQAWLPFRQTCKCPFNSVYVENTEGFF